MEPMTQSAPCSLTTVGLAVGFLVAVSHLAGLIAAGPGITAAKAFPRSRFWGTALLTVATICSICILQKLDLGEFGGFRLRFFFIPIIELTSRQALIIGTAVSCYLLWKFVPDFLSSRSLGFLLLLAAHPVLESTFLQHGLLKLLLALLAYGWALAGLFLVGMPYLHRDLIGWVCTERWRWNAACWAGVIYGALLLVLSLFS